MNQLMGAGELLKSAWADYKTKLKPLALLITGFYLVMGVVILITTGGSLATSYSQSNIQAGFIPFIIGMIVIGVLGILVEIALVYLASGTEVSPKSALMRAKGKFWSFLALAILLAVTIIAGFILVIIPGIIFMVWFGQSYFVLLLEDKKGVDAMKRSKSYVKGRFWQVLGRILLLVLVMIPFIILSNLGDEGSVMRFIFGAIVAIFVGPFAIVYAFHLYRNLKETVVVQQTAI